MKRKQPDLAVSLELTEQDVVVLNSALQALWSVGIKSPELASATMLFTDKARKAVAASGLAGEVAAVGAAQANGEKPGEDGHDH